MNRRMVLMLWVLAMVASVAGTGCKGEVLMAGHVTTLGISLGMFWATMNLKR